jgi:hypothetical protein
MISSKYVFTSDVAVGERFRRTGVRAIGTGHKRAEPKGAGTGRPERASARSVQRAALADKYNIKKV